MYFVDILTLPNFMWGFSSSPAPELVLKYVDN